MIRFLFVLNKTSQCKQQGRNVNDGSSFLIRHSHESYDSAYREPLSYTLTVQLKCLASAVVPPGNEVYSVGHAFARPAFSHFFLDRTEAFSVWLVPHGMKVYSVGQRGFHLF